MKVLNLLLLALLTCATMDAQVTLPGVLSNHMVIQRDLPVHVWGMALPGESVSVSFRDETRATNAGRLGHWSIYLKPGAAGGPFEMTVVGKPALNAEPAATVQTITLDDILVGDVWLASGQSNMGFQMRQAATAAVDLPQAANPRIRLLTVKQKAAEYAQSDIATDGWIASSPESAKEFSAVAWYFAREIEKREKVPIGIINSSWGGTMVESWTRLEALGEDASLMPVFASRGRMTDRESDALLEDVDHKKQIEDAKAQGKPLPEFPWHPELNMWAPGLLWNGMIAPLTQFPIRGVIWYQGESNSIIERSPSLYHRLFRTLIEDWRAQWGEGDFPFLYVQIANFKSGSVEDWATIRQGQLKTLELRMTAMAVTIDIGDPDNVHPTDKVDVGMRLALAARAIAYNEDINYSGPLFRQAAVEENSIRVWFDHSKGLVAKGGELTGFEVAGKDRRFQPAVARIEGETVVVNSPSVAEPVLARYGWANSPACNLFNSAGLPASPFTSEK
ncbi:MAG: sialate O-acetylesterase [Terracidiphilus sp.]|jgi:sialate O-acetylesterase